MKKFMKKFITLSLVLTMAVSGFAACSSNDGGSSGGASSSKAESSASAEDSSKAEDDKDTSEEDSGTAEDGSPEVEPVDYEISILTVSHDGTIISPDHPNFKTLKDHTGYDVKLEYILNASYAEQISTRLAGGDLPGLVVITGNSGPVVTAAKAGAFWDITDEYKNYPNLAQANEDIMKNISIEGRYYGIYRERVIGRAGMSYRSDWLENLGLEEPKTMDEFYDVLHAMTYDDPDGNGADDTYGMTWCVYLGPFENLAVMHGAPNYWGIDEENKLYPWFESEKYIDAMNFSKKLYDEGLINKDFAALQTGEWTNDFATGKSGFHIDVVDQGNRMAVSMKDNGFMTQEQVDDGEIVWVMGGVENADGDRFMLPTTGNAGYVAISTSGAKTEEDRDHYLTFMDRCNDKVGQNILAWGTEGVTYDFDEDGFMVPYTPEEIVERSGAGMENTAGWNQFGMNTVPDQMYPRKDNVREQRQREINEENLNYVVHNPTLPLTSDTYTAKASSLELIISDATINYITGKIDLDGFKAETQRWYDDGGQESLEEFQASYDSIN